jgi:DNA-binding MarR family transcriptional regulator
MKTRPNSPTSALVDQLVDEVIRLRGRVLSATREINEKRGLRSHSQGLIMSAVVHAAEPPTVARIARSLGLTRQSVQRTANELVTDGLLQFEDNPHHKRAKQLVATAHGLALHARESETRVQWMDQLGHAVSESELAQTVATLRRIRRFLEHPEAAVAGDQHTHDPTPQDTAT